MAGLKAQVGRVPVRSARKRIEVSVVVMMNTFMRDDKRHQGAIGRAEGCEPRGPLDLTAKLERGTTCLPVRALHARLVLWLIRKP